MTPCPRCGCEMMLQCDGTPQHVGRKYYECDLTFCLDRQVKALRKKVEILIDAGDAVAWRLGCGCTTSGGQCKYCDEAQEKWDKAKDS